MSAASQWMVIVIAGILNSVAAGFGMVAFLFFRIFLGSWAGYLLALSVILLMAAFIGWRLDRQTKCEGQRRRNNHG